MGRVGDAYVSEGDPTVVFPIEEGILSAFVLHEPVAGDVTQVIKAFYEEKGAATRSGSSRSCASRTRSGSSTPP